MYAVGNVALRGAGLLLTPVYTQNLSMVGYGLLASMYATAEFLVIFMALGMRTALVRFAKESEEDGTSGLLVGTTTCINLAAGLVVSGLCFLILPPLFRGVFEIEEPFYYVLAVCATAISRSVFIHIVTYYRARNEPRPVVVANVTAALLLIVVTVVLFLVLDYGVLGALAANAISYGAMILVVGALVVRRTGFGLSLHVARTTVRFGFPLVFSMCASPSIYTSTIYFLGAFAGLDAVAIFSLGQKLSSVASIILVLPFQMAFLPFAIANSTRPDARELLGRVLTYLLLGSTAVAVGILVGTRLVLPFIAPPEYAATFLVVLALCPLIIFNGLSVFGEGLLSLAQRTEITGSVMGALSLVGVGLNFLLIANLDVVGAILSLNAILGTMGIVVIRLGVRHQPISIEWGRILFLAGAFALFELVSTVGYYSADRIFYPSVAAYILLIPFAMYVTGFLVEPERAHLRGLAASVRATLARRTA